MKYDAVPEPNACPSNQGLIGPNTPNWQGMDDNLLNAVHVTGMAPCNGSVAFIVWVADAKTVTTLIDHYPGAQVAGWMQPVSRS